MKVEIELRELNNCSRVLNRLRETSAGSSTSEGESDATAVEDAAKLKALKQKLVSIVHATKPSASSTRGQATVLKVSLTPQDEHHNFRRDTLAALHIKVSAPARWNKHTLSKTRAGEGACHELAECNLAVEVDERTKWKITYEKDGLHGAEGFLHRIIGRLVEAFKRESSVYRQVIGAFEDNVWWRHYKTTQDAHAFLFVLCLAVSSAGDMSRPY